ncbi:MAG: hypothetical protein KKI09_10385 [Spirochaetes bacterium]|nr:hypothetical protein [Spirochaetota bacterium]MBU0955825.1 hypothetical protein [Spirochaetota bacterium]
MKRLAALLLIVSSFGFAFGKDLALFEEGLETFSTEMASVLSYNATIGNHWSDGYIGQLLDLPPHFGIGAAVGFTAIPAEGLSSLLELAGTTIPAELASIGLPIPAAAVSAKIGGFILPFDIGIKGMIIPDSLSASLASMGFETSYQLIGANIRYALLKEKMLIPEVVLGAGYNRLSGGIAMPLDIAAPSFDFDVGGTIHTLALSNPELSMNFTTDSFDFNVQVSKKVLFLRPYVGAALTIGQSAVKSGLAASMTYDDGTGPRPVTDAELTEIKTNMETAGIAVPDINAEGFIFSYDANDPVFRLYGGFSLSLFVVHLDTMVIYVPTTGSLGLNTMLRFQM